MQTEPEIASTAGSRLGEGPRWHNRRGVLLWVDILGSAVHQYDPVAGTDEHVPTPQHVGAVAPRAAGGLVLCLRDGVACRDEDGTFWWHTRFPEDGVRANDAAVDAHGRLWTGTVRYDERPGGAKLRRVDPDGDVADVLEAVTISNGLGWSPDGTLMYYVDTPTQRVDVFDFDADSGTIADRRPLVTVEGTPGVPDGLTVDADGCVWVALWGGGEVRRYTPDGRLDRSVRFPVSRTTACAFGGASLTDLYVTSAREGLDAAALAGEPHAGQVFVLPGAGQGLPGNEFAG